MTKQREAWSVGATAKECGFDGLTLRAAVPELAFDPNDAEPGPEYVREHKFQLVGFRWNDYVISGSAALDSRVEKPGTVLGTCETALFLGGYATNAGVNIIEEADAMAQELYDAAELMYREPEGLFSFESESKRLLNPCNSNGLYIGKLVLEPGYRGKGLGIRFMKRVIEYHDEANLGAVLIYPNARYWLEGGDPLAKMSEAEADTKLRRYYKRMGFEDLGDSREFGKKYMYLDVERFETGRGLSQVTSLVRKRRAKVAS